MIKNIFYSLFLHFILILLVYFSFNFNPPPEVEKTSKIAISFVVKSGNSDIANQAIKETQAPLVAQTSKDILSDDHSILRLPTDRTIKKKSRSHPKKSLPKPIDKENQDQAKIEPKDSKPKEKDAKTDANKIKELNTKTDVKQELGNPKEENKAVEVKEYIKKEQPEKVENEPVLEPENDEEDIGESQLNQPSFTENTIESLDLLVREKFNIQTQIKRCYKKSLDEFGTKNKVVVNAHIFIDRDGYIDLSRVIIKDFYKYDNPQEIGFHQAVDVVKQSLKFCSPIRNLPQEKYDIWKEINLSFDEIYHP